MRHTQKLATNGKTILSGDTFKLPIEIFSRAKGKIEMKGKKVGLF